MTRSEATLEEELATLGDDDVMDIANLTVGQTGIVGFVTITTAMGARGPRVKYFARLGKNEPSFSVSIADPPLLIGTSLPEEVTVRRSASVIEWVRRNRDALLGFWTEGAYWMVGEVSAHTARLKKVQPSELTPR